MTVIFTMKYKDLLRLAIGLSISVAAAQGQEQAQQSLNGRWLFTTNADAAAWDSITVPGNWDTLPAYSTYKGKSWYRREFTAPADWQGKRIRLKFDAVYHDSLVTLNGKELGSHNGEVPSFTLRGYKLKWDGSEFALPNLKPGDAVWKSDARIKPGATVKLFTPTGYDVADSE